MNFPVKLIILKMCYLLIKPRDPSFNRFVTIRWRQRKTQQADDDNIMTIAELSLEAKQTDMVLVMTKHQNTNKSLNLNLKHL